jgi:uncharacterized membrane protein
LPSLEQIGHRYDFLLSFENRPSVRLSPPIAVVAVAVAVAVVAVSQRSFVVFLILLLF